MNARYLRCTSGLELVVCFDAKIVITWWVASIMIERYTNANYTG